MAKIINPTDRDETFRYDRKEYVVPAGKSLDFVPKFLAKHYSNCVNGNCEVIFDGQEKNSPIQVSEIISEQRKKEPLPTMNYDEMDWNELREIAANRGIYENGMKKIEVIASLKAYDKFSNR